MGKSFLPETGLAVVALIWGGTFVVVKEAITSLAPFSFNCVRFSLAAVVVFVGMMIFRKNTFMALSLATLKAGTILGIWLFVGFSFLTLGLKYTSATNAGFITGSNVVIVPLLSLLFFKQRLSWLTIAGGVAALLGLFFLTFKGVGPVNKGDIFTFVGAVGFAFHVISTGKYSRKCPPLLLVVVQLAVVGGCSGVCAWLFEDLSPLCNTEIIFSGRFLGSLSLVVLLATGLALVIQTKVQKVVTPEKVALIYSLEPVFAAIFGHYYCGEILGSYSIFGCALIFSGMIIVELPHYLRVTDS